MPCRPVSEGTAAPYKLVEPLIRDLVEYRRPSHLKKGNQNLQNASEIQ
jgi:hypothetical protein